MNPNRRLHYVVLGREQGRERGRELGRGRKRRRWRRRRVADADRAKKKIHPN